MKVCWNVGRFSPFHGPCTQVSGMVCTRQQESRQDAHTYTEYKRVTHQIYFFFMLVFVKFLKFATSIITVYSLQPGFDRTKYTLETNSSSLCAEAVPLHKVDAGSTECIYSRKGATWPFVPTDSVRNHHTTCRRPSREHPGRWYHAFCTF